MQTNNIFHLRCLRRRDPNRMLRDDAANTVYYSAANSRFRAL